MTPPPDLTVSAGAPVQGRGTAAWVLAALCVLTALVQLAAGLKLFSQPELGVLMSTADSATRMRVVLLLAIPVLMNLSAGVCVVLMRVEALACLGCLLARLFARMLAAPVPLSMVVDLSILLALIYFMVRLFAQAGWRRPAAMLLTGLAAGHLTVLANDLPSYPALVSTGSVPPLLALAALIGCAAFYAAVFMLHLRPAPARKLFLFAALAIGLSLPAWHHRDGLSAPYWLGVPLALAGFALARRSGALR